MTIYPLRHTDADSPEVIHTEWRSQNFQCSLCGKLYSRTSGCQRHIKQHHPDQPDVQVVQIENQDGYMAFKDFRCSVCGMVSKTQRRMIVYISLLQAGAVDSGDLDHVIAGVEIEGWAEAQRLQVPHLCRHPLLEGYLRSTVAEDMEGR
jgi:uncharacterized C2H2 Zn-finger protein